MKLSQTIANTVSALIATWMGIVATGALNGLVDDRVIHGVSLVCSFISLFLINMGYNRTPSGTVLPEVVSKMVDTNQAAVSVSKPGTTTQTTVVEAATMKTTDAPSQTTKEK